MGQQQLLLLILGIVIVGIAVVIGIAAFGESRKKANADALVNDLVRLASEAQAWMLKPSAYGGGNNSCETTCDWRKASFSVLGYAAVDQVHSNLNGRFAMGTLQPPILIIVGLNEDYGNLVAIGVAGTTPDLIATVIVTDLTPFGLTEVAGLAPQGPNAERGLAASPMLLAAVRGAGSRRAPQNRTSLGIQAPRAAPATGPDLVYAGSASVSGASMTPSVTNRLRVSM